MKSLWPRRTKGGLALLLVMPALAVKADPPAPEDAPHPLVIVTHVDVMPPFTAPAIKLLWDYREDSLKDKGVERIEVLEQVGRPNHFTVVEEWDDQKAYDGHVSAAHTRQFRADLAPMLGAPFDERPHSVVKSGSA
jgi:quinol monooxygenase YgiN